MARLSWGYAKKVPGQLAVALFGIALGVAAIVAIELAIQSAKRAFQLSRSAVVGQSTHQIVSGRDGLDERIHSALFQRMSQLRLTPVVEGRVRLTRPTHRSAPVALRLIGIDPFAPPDAGWNLRDMTFGPAQGGQLTALMVNAGTVALTAPLARKLSVSVGGQLTVRHQGRQTVLTVHTILQGQDDALRAFGDTLLTDISTAQEALGLIGRLSTIALTLPDAPTKQLLEPALPASVQLRAVGAEAGGIEEITAAFNLNLRMLALLAVVVGTFLIYNTVSFGVTRRRQQFGILRALGVRRIELVGWIAAESLAMGLVGGLLGLALGLGLAEVLIALVSQTINDLYYVTEVRAVVLALAPLLFAAGIGAAAAVAAGLVPAVQIGRLATAQVLSGAADASAGGPRSFLLPLTTVGALTGGGAAWFVYVGLPQMPGAGLWPAFVGLFALVCGAACLTPVAILAVLWSCANLGRSVVGLAGRLAIAEAMVNLNRTAVAGAALVVALATTVGVAIMVDSFRASVESWLERTLRADIYIGGPGSPETRTIPRDLAQRVAAWPEVSDVSLGHRRAVRTADGEVSVLGLRMARQSYAGLQILRPADPSHHAAVWGAFDRDQAVLLTEPYANRHGIGPGDTVSLLTASGPHDFLVVGVYRDYASQRGTVMMSWTTFESWWPRPRITGMGVYLQPGTDTGALLARLQANLPAGGGLVASPNQRIKARSLVIFDRTFTITEALRLVALSVAICGIFSALLAVALERRRHYANLRAQGMTRRQLFVLMQMQSGVFGLAAGLVALPLGILLADVLVNVINLRAFGWSMGFELHPSHFVLAPLAAVLSAMLAALWPARQIARASPASALRGE